MNVERWAPRWFWILATTAVLSVMFFGCGGSGSVVGPSDSPAPTPPPTSQRADLPSWIYGAFAASEDVPEAAAHAGSVVLVIPTYADDPRRVASALRANGKVAIVSAHHVFGGPKSGWESGWQKTKEWMAELPVAAVLVVDEPLHNGIPAADRDEAIARVRADGYRTMTTETVDRALISGTRPPVDLFGSTCYYWPGPGSWSQDRCLTAYASHPSWDVVIGQSYDDYSFELDPASFSKWVQMARSSGKRGVLFWVWRWAEQRGIGDHDGYLRAFDAAGRQ